MGEPEIENRHFEEAGRKARKIALDKDRLKSLIQNVVAKISKELPGKLGVDKLRDRLIILVRMIRSYIKGDYKIIPWKTLVSVAAALIYFVTPFDLIPDFIPVTGLLDDFTVILWVFKSFQSEIDDFLEWEKNL